MELFRKGCETACYLDAKGVLGNGPLLPYLFPEDMEIHRHYTPEVLRYTHIPDGLVWGQWRDWVMNCMDEACDIASSFGLDYYLHPCIGALTDTTDAYLLLKRELGRTNLKFCLDTANQFFMRENLRTALRKLAGELDYIHLSDTGGECIEHQPPGKGRIAWDDFFATLKIIGFKGNIAVDVGGEESHITDLDNAFLHTAQLIEEKLKYYEIY
ncbi:MAG: sugar phosphate isomerase/epimerase [Bacteroides sp.]|nr:sugar phosphate isomerase/epimerase [Bacteroides sp.]